MREWCSVVVVLNFKHPKYRSQFTFFFLNVRIKRKVKKIDVFLKKSMGDKNQISDPKALGETRIDYFPILRVVSVHLTMCEVLF